MKSKIFLIVLLPILIIFNLNAQTLLTYGLKLGTSASNPVWKIGSHSYDGVETKMGMDIGFFLDWSLTDKISMLTEIHYIQKGLRFYQPVINYDSYGFSVYVESIKPNVNYLSFPINIKYNMLSSEVIPYIIGGLRIDFMLSKSETNNPRWLYNNVRHIDFGGDIGLGFQTKSFLGIGTGLEVKYSPSFIKVSSTSMAEITNRSFEINFVLYH